MHHNRKKGVEPPAPANEQEPPKPEDGRRDNSLNRLKRLEYKLDHLDEKLTDILQRLSSSPENAEPEAYLSDELVHRLYDMLSGTTVGGIQATQGSVLVDPDQVRMLLKEFSKPMDERLRKLAVQLTDMHKRLEDFETPPADGRRKKKPPVEPPEEVKSHPFYPQFHRLGSRLRQLIEEKGWTQKRTMEEFNVSERALYYGVKIGNASIVSALSRTEFTRNPTTGRYHPGVSMIKYRALDEWLQAEGF